MDGAWATFCRDGLPRSPFAEDDGGFGGGAVDLMAAMDAFGEALVLEPCWTVGAGRPPGGARGSAAQRQALCRLIDPGRHCWPPPHHRSPAAAATSRTAGPATRSGAGWNLSGEKCVVIGTPAADTLVVSARPAAPAPACSWCRPPPGMTLRATAPPTARRRRVALFEQVATGRRCAAGEWGGALAALDETVDSTPSLAPAAPAVGAMQDAATPTLEYLKTRKQFGRAIGSLPGAAAPRPVDMFVATELARSMSMLAATQVDDAAAPRDAGPHPRSQLAVSQAKLKVCDSRAWSARSPCSCTGGMGMTEEPKVSHTFRRPDHAGSALPATPTTTWTGWPRWADPAPGPALLRRRTLGKPGSAGPSPPSRPARRALAAIVRPTRIHREGRTLGRGHPPSGVSTAAMSKLASSMAIAS